MNSPRMSHMSNSPNRNQSKREKQGGGEPRPRVHLRFPLHSTKGEIEALNG